MSSNNNYLVRIKKVNEDRSDNDLAIRFYPTNSLPFIVIEDSMLEELGFEESNSINTNFGKELYKQSEDEDGYINIINVILNRYGYSLRLIYDSDVGKLFFTYNLDYIPLINTVRRSEIIPKYMLGGLKDNRRLNIDNQILDHSLTTSSDRYDDITYPEPDTNSSNFKLYSLNLRGIMNPIKTRKRISDNRTGETNYYETNEIYFLQIDKKKVLGDDTSPYIYSILPVSGNKFSLNYIGRVSDIDYLYIPIIL